MEGVKEELAKNWRKYFEEAPDVILFHVGTNNLKQDGAGGILNIEEIVGRCKELIVEARRLLPCSSLVLSGVVHRRKFDNMSVDFLNTKIRNLCRENGVFTVDPNRVIDSNCFAIDRLHLNQVGIDRLSEFYTEVVRIANQPRGFCLDRT